MYNTDFAIIGDVHGKINNYWKLLTGNLKGLSTIQVGDFGFSTEHLWHQANIDPEHHRINFGNHDDYDYLNSPHSLGDFSYFEERKIMTVRGAYSIDRSIRKEYVDWFPNEELNYHEMYKAVAAYQSNKPKIMISHDCPHEVRKELFGITDKSITSNGLQAMFEHHQPEMWIFGHHHQSVSQVINGTLFICLNELETIII
jgi:predicted phosphodiesterase